MEELSIQIVQFRAEVNEICWTEGEKKIKSLSIREKKGYKLGLSVVVKFKGRESEVRLNKGQFFSEWRLTPKLIILAYIQIFKA